MARKYKKSVYFGIVTDCDCRAVAMCNLFYDHTSKPRIGHLKTDRYQEFDYDRFMRKGYAETSSGYTVLKRNGDVLATAANAFGNDGFNRFIASIIRLSALEDALDAPGVGDRILYLAKLSLHRTGGKMAHMELRHDSMLRLDKFVLDRGFVATKEPAK